MIESTTDESQSESNSEKIESTTDESQSESNSEKIESTDVTVQSKSENRNKYLSLYRTLCHITLFILPVLYMKAQFEIWKIKMIADGKGSKYWADGFLEDGWLDFNGFTTADRISEYGLDLFTLLPFVLAFMGMLAFSKIISLLFIIDNRTYPS